METVGTKAWPLKKEETAQKQTSRIGVISTIKFGYSGFRGFIHISKATYSLEFEDVRDRKLVHVYLFFTPHNNHGHRI